MSSAHRIVIAGGGASGRELATKLGDRYIVVGRARFELATNGLKEVMDLHKLL